MLKIIIGADNKLVDLIEKIYEKTKCSAMVNAKQTA